MTVTGHRRNETMLSVRRLSTAVTAANDKRLWRHFFFGGLLLDILVNNGVFYKMTYSFTVFCKTSGKPHCFIMTVKVELNVKLVNIFHP